MQICKIHILFVSTQYKRHLHCIIREFKLGTNRGGCGRQKTCCPLITKAASKQHEAVRRVPTNMIFSGQVKVVRIGPGSIAECGAGVTSMRVFSSTGSEARLGVAASVIRQRGKSADSLVT